jgi:tripartite-type tricarboxylate transporter receptor subunit TctC
MIGLIKTLSITIGFLSLTLGPQVVRAQEYPTRPIKIIINVSVGGVFDTFTRALGAELQKQWTQPVIIEPRPGGNFILAGRACAEAAPDGYTLCALTGETLIQAPLLYKDARYTQEKAFVPISQLFYSTQLFVAHSGINVRSLADLPEAAKKEPISFAGLTLSNRLFISRFNKRHGTDIVFVPQRGGSDAVNNVVAGTTGIAISSGATFLPLVQDKRVIPLAVDSLNRSPLYPEVQTLTEAGYPERIARNYLGLVVPAGTPEPVISRVYETVARIASSPDFRERSLIQKGLEPVFSTPKEFGTFLADDTESFISLMKEADIVPQ